MLNLGPVISFQNHRHFGAKFLEVLRCYYTSLEDIAGKSTEVRDDINWYLDFRHEGLRCATKSNQRL